MDPLGAIRTMITPEMRGAAQKLTQQMAANARQSIPTAELQQLVPTDLRNISGGAELRPSMELASPGGASFADVFGQMVQDVNSKQFQAADAAKRLIAGQPASLHEAVIAMEEASVSFQLMVETRNKLLEAYQELMRMQV